jgi:hypothetical protein
LLTCNKIHAVEFGEQVFKVLFQVLAICCEFQINLFLWFIII